MDLLERQSDLERLELLWATTAKGWGRTLLVSGEAGVGKTSLIQKFSRSFKSTSVFLQGFCERSSTGQRLGPLFDMAPFLSRGFGQRLHELSNTSAVFATFLADIVQLNKPVCLVIDDAQWAEPCTLEFIQYLSRRIERLPVLLLISYRTCELSVDHPLKVALGAIVSAQSDQIELRPLSRSSVDSLALQHQVRPDLLYELTQGNPFYITEVLNTQSETLPDAVIRFVLAKVATMSCASRQLCELISTIPKEADLSVIGQIRFGEDRRYRGDDPEIVERCARTGLIVFTGTGLKFRHEIARRVVENSLDTLKRKSWHGALLDIMIRDQSLPKSRLVHHAAQAGLGALVVELAPVAAKEAASVGAHREACYHYATAIPYAKHSPLHTQAMLYEGWAYHGLMSTSMDARFVEALKRAITLWKEIGNVERVGYNLRMLSVLNWSLGRIDDSFACVGEAISLLESISPSPALAMAYSMRSQIHLASSQLEMARFWAEKALQVTDLLDAREARVQALCSLGTAMMRLDDADGERMLRRSIELGEDGGYHEHTGVAYINLCESLLWQCRLNDADSVGQAGLEFMKRAGAGALSFSLFGLLAQIAARSNRFSDAKALAQKVLSNVTLSALVQWPALEATAMCLNRVGDPSGQSKLEELLELSKKLSLPQYQMHAYLLKAETHWIAGDTVRAKQALQQAFELRGDGQNPWLNGQLAVWWLRLYTNLEPSNLPTNAKFAAPYEYEIRDDLIQAAAWWGENGFVFEQALCLMQSGESGLVLAAELLAPISATPAMHRLRLLARKLKIQGVKRGHYGLAASNRFHLTQREIAILRFVAEGMSDAEIADRVARSKRTIQNHVGSLLSKVGAKNRLTLVSVVQRSGLI